MKIRFYSFQEGLDTISFVTEAKLYKSCYSFIDLMDGDEVYYDILSDTLINFLKDGKNYLSMKFNLKEKTQGFFRNKEGLEFSFNVITNEIRIEKRFIKIDYSMEIDLDIVNNTKIMLVFED